MDDYKYLKDNLEHPEGMNYLQYFGYILKEEEFKNKFNELYLIFYNSFQLQNLENLNLKKEEYHLFIIHLNIFMNRVLNNVFLGFENKEDIIKNKNIYYVYTRANEDLKTINKLRRIYKRISKDFKGFQRISKDFKNLIIKNILALLKSEEKIKF